MTAAKIHKIDRKPNPYHWKTYCGRSPFQKSRNKIDVKTTLWDTEITCKNCYAKIQKVGSDGYKIYKEVFPRR